jgi:hypothetical protein
MGMRGPVPGPQRDLRSDIVDLEVDLLQLGRLYDHIRKSLCDECAVNLCSAHQPARGFIMALRRNSKTRARDIEAEIEEARELARLMYGILTQFPTDLIEYDDKLDIEKLPDWLTKQNVKT